MEPDPFTESCLKCRGKGLRWFGRDTPPVTCRPCGGTGERTFKASAESRAHIREVAKARKAKKLSEAIEAFKVENPVIWEWMSTADVEFASKMKDALLKWGTLTEKQFAASQKLSKFRYTKRCLL